MECSTDIGPFRGDVQAKQAEDDLHEDSHAQGQGRGKAASWTVWAAKVLLSTTVPTIT